MYDLTSMMCFFLFVCLCMSNLFHVQSLPWLKIVTTMRPTIKA